MLRDLRFIGRFVDLVLGTTGHSNAPQIHMLAMMADIISKAPCQEYFRTRSSMKGGRARIPTPLDAVVIENTAARYLLKYGMKLEYAGVYAIPMLIPMQQE